MNLFQGKLRTTQYFVPNVMQDRMPITIIHSKPVRPSRVVLIDAHHDASRPLGTWGVKVISLDLCIRTSSTTIVSVMNQVVIPVRDDLHYLESVIFLVSCTETSVQT